MRLGVVDQSPIRMGDSPAAALADTVALAKAADAMGYHRFWLAEHHASPAFAGTAPEILIGHLADRTSRMRIGSGGVMLSHYAPLKVAETFRMLEVLHPGRIDLGLGRAPGSDGLTARALQAGPQAWSIDEFPRQLADVVAFLDDAVPGGHPYARVSCMPTGPTSPEVWLLGSGGYSAIYAGVLGLPFAYAHFINPEGSEDVVRVYREQFRPSARLAEPKVALSVFALAAETGDEAMRLAATRDAWAVDFYGGHLGPFPSVERALGRNYTALEAARLAHVRSRGVVGAVGEVADRLGALAHAHGAEEIQIVTITHDLAPRIESYGLLAEALPAAMLAA